MRDARYESARGDSYGPYTFELRAGERLTHQARDAAEAQIVALLAAAIARPSAGAVTINDFDTRVQPAHCKRAAAFIAHDPLPMTRQQFERYVHYRAALWNEDAAQARMRAQLALERLEGVHEAFAFPLAAALSGAPELVVFDRPPAVYAGAMFEAALPAAVFVASAAGPHA